MIAPMQFASIRPRKPKASYSTLSLAYSRMRQKMRTRKVSCMKSECRVELDGERLTGYRKAPSLRLRRERIRGFGIK